MIQITIEEILAPLLLKLDEIKRLSTKKAIWEIENSNVLIIEINFFQIKQDLVGYPYKEAISKLNEIKSTINDLCSSEVEMEILITNMFQIKDTIDFKCAVEIIVEGLNTLISKIDALIKHVYDLIPPEILLDKTLKIDFFKDLIFWTDIHRNPIIQLSTPKIDKQLSEQFFSIYKERPLETAHQINFLCPKGAAYYILYKIAETNKQLTRERFFENSHFKIHKEKIIYSALRKGVNNFEKADTNLKLLIDDYFKPYLD